MKLILISSLVILLVSCSNIKNNPVSNNTLDISFQLKSKNIPYSNIDYNSCNECIYAPCLVFITDTINKPEYTHYVIDTVYDTISYCYNIPNNFILQIIPFPPLPPSF